MTPESARASNQAAKQAGWFAANWAHQNASIEGKFNQSDKMKNHTKRERIIHMLKKNRSLTTCQIRSRLVQTRATVHGTLQSMAEEGTVKMTYVMIEGRKHCVWSLK
jgi:predicted transcriptional regulator